MKKLFYAVMLLLGLSVLAISCKNRNSSSKNERDASSQVSQMATGYEWLEGTWKYDGDEMTTIVRVTPEYFQSVRKFEDEALDIDKADRRAYTIKVLHNNFIGDETALVENSGTDNEYADFYIDGGKKQIFFLYDFDQKVYLTK